MTRARSYRSVVCRNRTNPFFSATDMTDGAQDFSSEDVRKWFDKIRPFEPDFEGKMKCVVELVDEDWEAKFFADALVSPFSLFSSSVDNPFSDNFDLIFSFFQDTTSSPRRGTVISPPAISPGAADYSAFADPVAGVSVTLPCSHPMLTLFL